MSMPKRILVVDDNIEFLRLLSSLLQKQFQTYEATGVEDALKVLETVTVDAICSDLNMGDGTGLELLQKLRLADSHIPFLLMSGMNDYFIISEVESYGAQFCAKTDLDLLMKIKAMAHE